MDAHNSGKDASPRTTTREPSTQTEGIRMRAIVVGIVVAALTSALVTQAEIVLSTLRIGFLQFPPAALGMLLLSVAVNRIIKLLNVRWGLNASDLTVIYCMLLVAAMISSHGLVEKWIPSLVAPKYFGGDWEGRFDAHIPPRLVPYDPTNPDRQPVADWYYERVPAGGTIPWQPWVVPLLNWGIFIALFVFGYLCLTVILRRQWADNERISFPLTQLPLEIARDEDGHTFFRNPLLWLGVVLPVGVYGTKALHQAQPSIPDIAMTWDMGTLGLGPPWDAAYCTYFNLSFAAVGFFFLLPTDILFSIWFFFLLSRVQMITAAAYNLPRPGMSVFPLPVFIAYQTIGAYVVLIGYFLLMARPYLKRIWDAANGGEQVDDSREFLSYPVAVWGLLGSIAASALWLWLAGMSLWLAVLEMVVSLLVIAVVMARATSEAGLLMTETTFLPSDLCRMFAPLHTLGPTNLTLLALVDHVLPRDQRGLLLAGMLDSTRLADATPLRRRPFAGSIILGVVVAIVVAVGLNIYLPYNLGAVRMDAEMEQAHAKMMLNYYAPYLKPGTLESPGATVQMLPAFCVGVVITILLTRLRAAFFWWPLHPLGYALSGSWGTIEFWFPCFMAWVLKALTMRYGGMKLFVRARPFFLGLVLGEFGMMALLVLLNVFLGLPPPPFPWF